MVRCVGRADRLLVSGQWSSGPLRQIYCVRETIWGVKPHTVPARDGTILFPPHHFTSQLIFMVLEGVAQLLGGGPEGHVDGEGGDADHNDGDRNSHNSCGFHEDNQKLRISYTILQKVTPISFERDD